MFLDTSFVVTLFKLINFFAIISLIIYAFKKYVLNDIKKQIKDKQKSLVDLQEKATGLVNDIRIIEQDIQKNELICRALKARVVEWRTQAEQITIEKLKKRQEQKAILTEHMYQKTMHLQRQRAYATVLPTAIQQSQAVLEQKFKDEITGETFIAQLITSMQRSNYETR